VAETTLAWEALGGAAVGPTPSEQEGLRFRRSLCVIEDVRAGDAVTRANVRSIRPAGGVPPGEIETVLGRVFSRDAARGTPLTWSL
jgi:N-acetylneuraminate synthase